MSAARIVVRRILSQGWGAVVIVASLAVGIGLNGAMYAFFRATFVRPYAFAQSRALVEICQQERGSPTGNCVDSWPDLRDLREASQSYVGMTAYHIYGSSLIIGDEEKDIEITEVDPNFTTVTAVRPRYGRMFASEDFAQGAPLVGVLSDSVWRRTFLRDPRIVGGLIHIGPKEVRVVGIMPPEFDFPFNSPAFGAKGTELWIPLRSWKDKRTWRNLSAAALLKDGVGRRQAQAEASAVAERLASLHSEDKEYTFELYRLDHELYEYFGKTAEVAGLITALILILAILNINGILLAEHFQRIEEWRMRLMLGAKTWQLLRLFLVQSLALSCVGGGLGAWLAALFLRTAYRFLPSHLPHTGQAAVNWHVLAFVVVASALAGVVSGMWPLLVANPSGNGEGGLAGYGKSRESVPRRIPKVRRFLVMAQVGGAMALLSLMGMLLMHMHAAATVNVGFRSDHLVNFAWASAKPSWNGVELLRKNLEAIPGVESVAFTQNTPLAGEFVQKFLLSDYGSSSPGTEYSAYSNSVSSDYFRVMGIPLLAGRSFSEQEKQPGGYPTVVVNEAFVQRFYPTLPVLGRRLCVTKGEGETGCEWREIIGVAGNVRDGGIFDPAAPAFYLPWRQNIRPTGANICVRTRVPPESVLGLVRKAVSRTSPADHAFLINTVENLIRNQVSAGIVLLYGAELAAAVTILLAAGGLYGTLFSVVRQSRREIGIRMAIGATPSATTWHFARDAGKWIAVGLGIGILGAIEMNQSAQAAVYGLASLKIWVLAVAGITVILVSLLAVLLPLREAAHVDPAEVLRHD